MRALLWNVNGGSKARTIAWLAERSWDVAVLLEVRRPCWRQLNRPDWERTGTSEAAKTASQDLSVAVLHRPGMELVEVVRPPQFAAKGGRYAHRALAVTLKDGAGEHWTILALHMPNSRFRSGKDHGPKDECFRELRYWMASRPRDERLVIAMDANRSDWERNEGEPKRASIEVQTFLRRPDLAGLQDAYVAAHPDETARPETYWQPRSGNAEYFDRVMVNRWVGVNACELPLERDRIGKSGDVLSDHAAVLADLEAITPW